MWYPCQLNRVVKHRPVSDGQVSRRVIRTEGGNEVVLLSCWLLGSGEESTESRSVVVQSVVAAIDGRDRDGNHFPLDAT